MANLSDTFKYISQFRRAGHQIGRKVGDMLEVLTYAALCRDPAIHARLRVEPRIVGFSDAGHKVEFAVMQDAKIDINGNPVVRKSGDIKDPSKMVGFIECKKVGVEQTVNTTFKKNFSKQKNVVPLETPYPIRFRPRDMDVAFESEIEFKKNDYGQHTLSISDDHCDTVEYEIYPGHRYIFALTEDGQYQILDNDMSLRDVDESVRSCRILEIESVLEDGVQCLLNDCLSGPQTPEKAKQASFVALDVRRKRYGSFDKREAETKCVSVLVLTEFAHWEEKSQKMILACIDRNLVIDDSLIVDAFQKFEQEFGEHFIERITKDAFEKDAAVRQLAFQIVDQHDSRIFRDIEDDEYKKICFVDGELRIE